MKNNKTKHLNSKKKVAVALSGGIDSLVAAFLLKQSYPNLFGIHFTTGYETYSSDTLNKEELNLNTNLDIIGPIRKTDINVKYRQLDIQKIASQLDIPIFTFDLKEQFEKDVVSYFIKTYLNGKTPNPCVICNKRIKFGVFFQAAKDLGANALATGHYARIVDNIYVDNKDNDNIDNNDSPNYHYAVSLLKGKDFKKDQSYFLSMLSSEQLKHALFPLGELTKQEVKVIAAENGLVPIHNKESQDICFIREDSFADFISSKCKNPSLTEEMELLESKKNDSLQILNVLQTNCNIPQITDTFKSENLPPFAPGEIVTDDNKVVGRHKGLYCYTIGQRKGLNCPGPAPYYVKQIDMEHNRLVIGFKKELFQKECNVYDINWLIDTTSISKESLRAITQIRYSHSGASSTIIFDTTKDKDITHKYKKYDGQSHETQIEKSHGKCNGKYSGKYNGKYSGNRLKVIFDEPQLAVTPGQCAVFYDGEQVIGAGFIDE